MSEGAYFQLAQSSPDAILIQSEGRIVFANPAMLALVGAADASQVVGLPATSMLEPEFVPVALRGTAAGHGVGAQPNREQVCLRLDGSRVPVQVAATRILLEGRPAALLTVQDLSQRRAAERSTRRLADFYATLSQTNRAIIRTREPQALYQEICRICVEYGHANTAFIALIKDGAAMPVASAGPAQAFLEGLAVPLDPAHPQASNSIVTAIREDRRCVRNDISTLPAPSPLRDEAVRFGTLAVAAFPLRRGGKVIGALCLHGREKGFFEEDVVALIDDMTADLNYALENLDREAARADAEAALRRSEASLAAAQAHAGLGSWERDLGSTLARWSAEMFRLFARDPALGSPSFAEFLEMVHPQDRPSLVAAQERAASTGLRVGVEFRSNPANGPLRYFSVNIRPIDDAEGRIVALAGTVQDVTAAQLALAQLRESEARYRRLFEASPDAIYVIRSFRIVLANAAALRLFGARRPEELIGRHIFDLTHPDYHQMVEQRVLALEAGAEANPPVEQVFLRLDATPVHVDVLSTSFVYLGAPAGQVVARDIGERKRAEATVRELNATLERRVAERTAELEAANRELENFGHMISHDLRAPVRAIAGFGAELRHSLGGTLGARDAKYLDRVEKNARRMETMLADLLEFSRSSRAALNTAPVDMRALVRSILEETAADRSASVEIVLGELPPAAGDASLLRQVWVNLLSNAIKFSSGAPRPRIDIGARRIEGGVEYVVSDNGCGFDAAFVDKLFGVFQRLHSESEFPGNGVGLAIVKRIIERHGGSVSARSAPGAGAAFSFRLPG